MSLLTQIVLFATTLAAFMALSRWINHQVQVIGLRVTGSGTVTIMLYYLLMFPGILLHELSHHLTARLLGMRVGKFSMGPRIRHNAIELGSVTVSSGGPVRDSLVGLAPFLFGTAALLLVSYLVFDVGALGQRLAQEGWARLLAILDGIWLTPDFWVWAYVIFVVSNAMTPSPADRQPWLVASIYIGIALVAVWLLGGLPILAETFRPQVIGALHGLTLGFLFTAAMNLAIAAALWVTEVLIVGVGRSRR